MRLPVSVVRDFDDIQRNFETLSSLVPATPEPVHLVGATGEPGFQNTYANYGAGEEVAGFYRAYGRVWLQGLVTRTTGLPVNGETIFTLPTGYWPQLNQVFTALVGGPAVMCRVDVSAAGLVRYMSGAPGAVIGETDFISLAGISFRI